MMTITNFNPPFYLKNPMLQTFLNSAGIRKLGLSSIHKKSKEIILNAGDGVRLQGFLSDSKNSKPKGIVILIHGWEGSANSAYILTSCKYFLDNGYSVFRLNLRDHGESHHLNTGLFFGTLLEESFNAINTIAKINPNIPHFLIGFSMGANFVLRIASKAGLFPIENLKGVVAVNPPMDPCKATERIDSIDLIRKYFAKKFKKSLLKNEELYPGIYNFDGVLKKDTCMEITEILIKEYTDFNDARDYFLKYSLTEKTFADIVLPAMIITSEDDPVIPVEDFLSIIENDFIQLSIQRYGGHCGYIKNIMLKAWYLDVVKDMFSTLV